MSAGPRIFISHDREHAAGHAGRLYDSLVARFGEEGVVLPNGRTGPETMTPMDVLIAVVGNGWARAADREVGDEVATALEGGIRVIPALVQGAEMPASDELPSRLATLARRQPLELRDEQWREDVQALAEALERFVGQEAAPAPAGLPQPQAVIAPSQPTPAAIVEPQRSATWGLSLAAAAAGGGLLLLGAFLKIDESRAIDDKWVALEYIGTALGVVAVVGLVAARQVGRLFAGGAWAGIGLASLGDSLTLFLLTEGNREIGQAVLAAGGFVTLAAGLLALLPHVAAIGTERFAVTPPQFVAVIGGLLVALATFLPWVKVFEETFSIWDTPGNHKGAFEPLVPAAAALLVALLAITLGRSFAAGALAGLGFAVLLLFVHLVGRTLEEENYGIREGGPLGVFGALAVAAGGIALYASIRATDLAGLRRRGSTR